MVLLRSLCVPLIRFARFAFDCFYFVFDLNFFVCLFVWLDLTVWCVRNLFVGFDCLGLEMIWDVW